MKSCILTVIKNEQEYLDEWIKYHLGLGIQHIFIFEDIDSDCHKSITSKYGDRVSLNCIDIVLDEESKKKALEFKLTKRSSAHILYLKHGLSYIKANYQYDWCFAIDNDEFITFENDTLDDILLSFEGYDAFIMQWKCYGANGYVKKPDYGNKGLVGTYLKEMEGRLIGEPYHTKTCFNMPRYENEFFYNSHIPNGSKCNFCDCRTICIRHYITKSWEEYIWKRKTRGFLWGCRRGIDFFFDVNPDMKDRKDELMNELKEETLVVLPYKQNGSQGNEIRLSLKGWRKFCQFKYHFIVIGEFDDSLKNEFPWVEFIFCKSKDIRENQYNPHLDIQNKFKVVEMMYSQVYDGFIYMTDDEYAVKPFGLKDVTAIFYHSPSFNGCEKCPTSYWRYDKWKTRQLLDKENLPHVNYTTHHPCYFEFKKLDEIWKRYNMLEESYVFDDVYFNYFKHGELVLDSTIRLGIWNREIFDNEFQNAVANPSIKFMCNSVEGWSKELENELWNIIK